LKEHYAVETEFGISSLGGNIEYSKADTTISSAIKSNFVEVPITIKLLTDNINGKMKVFGKFGMNLGFATKSSAVISYKKNGVEYAKDDMKDASKYIQPLNVSLVIGGGVEYNLAKNLDLILGLTYTNGLLNTMKSPSIYRLNTSNPSIKAFDADMNYFAINVGLLF
jgi:opacity protein-like surface antigen